MSTRSSLGAAIILITFFWSNLAFANQNHSEFRISPEMVQNLPDNTLILDVRSTMDYDSGHLPGAVNLPVTWTYENQKKNGQIISPNRIQIIFRNLGIETDTPIVIYDGGQLVDAARGFWTLEVYGIKDVKVMSPGFKGWVNKDLPISFDKVSRPASQYVPVINSSRLATKLTTLVATKNPNQIIVDARPNKAYIGKISSAKRFGHIATAINISAHDNILEVEGQAPRLQSLDNLKTLYSDLPKNQKIVLYCAIGHISATNYLALRELGYNVSNYDASWKEWGNDYALPIEK